MHQKFQNANEGPVCTEISTWKKSLFAYFSISEDPRNPEKSLDWKPLDKDVLEDFFTFDEPEYNSSETWKLNVMYD